MIRNKQKKNRELQLSLKNAYNAHEFINRLGFRQTCGHQRYLKIYQKELTCYAGIQVAYAIFYEDDYIYEMDYLKEKNKEMQLCTG